MSYDNDKVKITYERLGEHMIKNVMSVTEMEYQETGYKKGNEPPKDGWMPFPLNTRIGGAEKHFWFKAKFKTPKAEENSYFILRCKTGREGEWNGRNPQCLLYLNGEMVQGFDTNHTDTYLEPDTEYEMYNYLYTSSLNDDNMPEHKLIDHIIDIKSVNTRIEKLYYDIRVPYECCLLHNQNTSEYIDTMSALVRTANCIDFRRPFSKEYFDSIEVALDFIEKEFYSKLCTPEGKPLVNCIGHSHIDVEWLWTRHQTREKIQRTTATVLTLMKKYPEFKFMLTQPNVYEYLKEEAPEVYERVKEAVAAGRWEPEGAMYVESDCNLVSGESLVRQILYGKQFFKDEFGVDCKLLFLPDVFGYGGTLPQIMNKTGIDYFVSSKINCNDTNTMPYDTFVWKGIDGSEIFTSLLTTQEYSVPYIRHTIYGGKICPSWVKGSWERYRQKDYSKSTIFTFGWGDGGGGPTKEMLENARRLEKGIPGMPAVTIKPFIEVVKDVKEQFDKGCERTGITPKWDGEIYFEWHRGTYTSIAKNKRGNRKSELMLQNVEALSSIDKYFGGEYDDVSIKNVWKRVLHNQFHDIIPGSSIKEVYELTDVDYKEIAEYGNDVINNKLSRFANDVKAQEGYLVYNPLGFARQDNLLIDGKTVDLKEEIPAFGWKVIKDFSEDNSVKISGLEAENKYYIVALNNAGQVTRIYDKEADREVIVKGKAANEMQIFEDMPNIYDNWEISDYYEQKCRVLNDDCKIEPIVDGTRAGFRVERKYMDSKIVQNIWLYSNSRRIDFENDIDWAEDEQLLKFAFPVDIHFNSATYEVQYGNVKRPTHRNTSWDKAKFEVYGHKWIDVSETGYGVALLNDCKYGYNVFEDTIKITAIKCGRWPNVHDDRERHIFTYSLLPHMGSYCESGVIHEAYKLNQPLMSAPVSASAGTLDNEMSFVSCDKENVIIETVKKAEKDDSLIVRMYDSFDAKTKATITVKDGYKKAYVCDLLENETEELKIENNKVTVSVSNFEIVTLKFTK